MAEINTEAVAGNVALAQVLESILVDLTALKSAADTLATKLNADAGVTDTNYVGAATLTTTT